MAGGATFGNQNAIKSEIGKTYGQLTVIHRVENRGDCAAWLCKCNCGCGTTKIATGFALRRGQSSSCKSRKLTEKQIYDRTHGERECHTCKQMKPCEEFPSLTRHDCKACRGRNTHKLRQNYGITEDEYNQMLSSQNGVCAICSALPPNGRKKYLEVDHEHTGKKVEKEHVRGLLCGSCNSGLGYFGDSLERLEKACVYLRAHISKNNA